MSVDDQISADSLARIYVAGYNGPEGFSPKQSRQNGEDAVRHFVKLIGSFPNQPA